MSRNFDNRPRQLSWQILVRPGGGDSEFEGGVSVFIDRLVADAVLNVWWIGLVGKKGGAKGSRGWMWVSEGLGGEEEVGLNPLSDVMVFVMVFRLQWVFCGAIAIAVNKRQVIQRSLWMPSLAHRGFLARWLIGICLPWFPQLQHRPIGYRSCGTASADNRWAGTGLRKTVGGLPPNTLGRFPRRKTLFALCVVRRQVFPMAY